MHALTGFVVCFLFLFGTTNLSAEGKAKSSSLAVVTGHASSIDGLTAKELQHIYLGKLTHTAQGSRIVSGQLQAEAERFYGQLLNMTLKRVSRHWIGVVFSGESISPPIKCVDRNDIHELLTKNQNALCFVPLDLVDSTMKVLPIDGHLPEDQEYPLAE